MVQTRRFEAIPGSRLALLFGLFFCICWGLGYPSLNRVDWRKAPGGLSDVLSYAGMVEGAPPFDADGHTQFRVLVPDMAKPIYRMAQNHTGSWDPIMLSLLLVDSFFVAVTGTVLVMVVNREVGSYAIALGSALIYLLNFAVPNLRLVGMIDAGEACFLMLLVWSLTEERYWMLPVWGVLGAMAKESFVPFLVVFSVAWWISSRKTMRMPRYALGWMAASWVAAVVTLVAVQWRVKGAYQSPLKFGLGLHSNSAYLSHFVRSLGDRNLWYIFFWLLPLSVVRLGRLPVSWRVATAATSVTAFALDAYYGGEPGTIGRALFSIAGPLLSASVAILLFTRGGGDLNIEGGGLG
jgi:hypothetical protein